MVVVRCSRQYIRCTTFTGTWFCLCGDYFRTSWCGSFGRLIIFDPTKGRKSTFGMVQEFPYRNRPIKEGNQRSVGGWCMAAVYQTDAFE